MDATKPIPVRLPESLIARLDKAAAEIGVKRANIMRFCVETWVAHYQKTGKAALPVNWREIIASFDNRRTIYTLPPPTCLQAAENAGPSPTGQAAADNLVEAEREKVSRKRKRLRKG